MRNSLRKIDGVRQVEVDLDDEAARVIVSTEFDSQILVAATTNIGFPSVVRKAE